MSYRTLPSVDAADLGAEHVCDTVELRGGIEFGVGGRLVESAREQSVLDDRAGALHVATRAVALDDRVLHRRSAIAVARHQRCRVVVVTDNHISIVQLLACVGRDDERGGRVGALIVRIVVPTRLAKSAVTALAHTIDQ